MKHYQDRTSADITIYTPDGKTLLVVPITADSERVVRLMTDDYITLHFSEADGQSIPVGAWCEDEIFGKFVVTEEQSPSFNPSTGGYDYTLKMEAWYKAWNLKLMMLVEDGDRTTSVWYLTNTLKEQMRQFFLNIQALGFCAGMDFWTNDTDIDKVLHIGDEVSNAKQAMLMSYETIKLTDALKQMADTWGCEYWVDGTEENFVIHFGKCEVGADEYGISTEYIEQEDGTTVGGTALSVKPQRGLKDYANKIYAYGGTSNIPIGYRKKVNAKITAKEYVRNTEHAYDMLCYQIGDMELENDMFSETGYKETLTAIMDNAPMSVKITREGTTSEKRSLSLSQAYYVGDLYDDTDAEGNYDQTFVPFGGQINASSSESVLTLTFPKGQVYDGGYGIENNKTIEVNIRFEHYDTVNQMWVKDYDLFVGKQAFNVDDYTEKGEDGKTYFTGKPIEMPYTPVDEFYKGYKSTLSNFETRINFNISIALDGWKYNEIETAYVSTYNKITIEATDGVQGIAISWKKNNGRTYRGVIRFNPLNQERHVIRYVQKESGGTFDTGKINYHYWFELKVTAGTAFRAGEEPEVGDTITIDSTGAYLVPSAYYSTNFDDPSALFRMGDNRLRLPVNTVRQTVGDWVFLPKKGYIIHKDLEKTPNAANVQESVVTFDDIYPEAKMRVAKVTSEERTQNEDFSGETEYKQWQYKQYHLNLQMLDGSDFHFEEKFRLSDTALELRFLTPEDADMSASEHPDNFKLTGQKFEVAFSDKINVHPYLSDKTNRVELKEDFCLVRSNSSGSYIPNETLRPTVGDPVVLTGWNPNAIAALGAVDSAEMRLLNRALAYIEALQEGNFTFTAEMSKNFCFGLAGGNGYALPWLGQRVCVYHKGLAKAKHTRVIGYKLKLDMPFDTPTLTCGETEAYSYLKELENKVKGVTKSMNKYMLGSGSEDINTVWGSVSEYSVRVTSSNGDKFTNGDGKTTLASKVYLGEELIEDETATESVFTYTWKKLDASGNDTGWEPRRRPWEKATSKVDVQASEIKGTATFVCEVALATDPDTVIASDRITLINVNDGLTYTVSASTNVVQLNHDGTPKNGVVTIRAYGNKGGQMVEYKNYGHIAYIENDKEQVQKDCLWPWVVSWPTKHSGANDSISDYPLRIRVYGTNTGELIGAIDFVTVMDGAQGAPGLQGLQGEKGERGIPGTNGTNGKDGADGKTSYFHIKYSSVAKPTTVAQLTETPSTYIGTYVDFTAEDSADPTKYTWSRFEGAQGAKGDQGIPGVGVDGKTSYLHIAYANSEDGSRDFNVAVFDGALYIGQYTDFTEADSTDYTRYKWSRIKGEQGENGTDALNVIITASNGGIFKNGQGTTTLTALFIMGGEDITSTLDKTKFVWTKKNSDGSEDTAWNTANKGKGNIVTVTADDVDERATFFCEYTGAISGYRTAD